MAANTDAFRRFQEELAALDRAAQQHPAPNSQEAEMSRAKSEFLLLRKRYNLSVADVIAFFPQEDGIEYLRQIIAESEHGARRAGKRQASSKTKT
ncbi:MAG: 2-hydroxyacyl-CoA dehydratase [Pseudomonadota bacterium]|jgi:hypothetical protein|uniref:2-hydroxyacyl-CoA dehydratase n=1 Tax=Metallibacterium scheffleri TaxID=993689 RepID=A0A4S3KQA3_9GAMM|nr:hypothetical protein [Metallibacterium scheffleri]MBU6403814.1 2-hydroxyacyl-CoA dehydratase [Pseudomonadota bacterium]MDE3141066.1 2-hydroxyacyl-CoA dehydratase [Pseudomonadota bacterium]THD11076.1 hypothetical protein B1806_04940 [Metallibacterium scheffleri]